MFRKRPTYMRHSTSAPSSRLSILQPLLICICITDGGRDCLRARSYNRRTREGLHPRRSCFFLGTSAGQMSQTICGLGIMGFEEARVM